MDALNNLNPRTPRRGQRQRSFAGGGSGGPNDDDLHKKKLLHRDIERQRRQEMTALFASLRNQLPVEYIKGKRAVSDHINGAVSFIKDMQERIKEMSGRRDELKGWVGSSNFHPNMAGSSKTDPASIVVQPCTGGVEVVVSSAVVGFEALPLSRVLQVILEQGLEVICCITARVNERLMHTIQVEVSNWACIDVAGLQQKLIEELLMMG